MTAGAKAVVGSSGGGGKVPAPASTVTGPDAFGAAAVVGVGTTYARADHDHGLPAAPVPATPSAVYGDGSDGSPTFDGTTTILGIVPSSNVYTLTRDLYLASPTINVGVTIDPSGFRLFANGTLTNNGVIANNGIAASGTNGATGGTAQTGQTFGGNGGVGQNGVTGNGNIAASLTQCLGSGGGAGGGGATTTGGGTPVPVLPPSTAGSIHAQPGMLTGYPIITVAGSGFKPGCGGSSGGGDGTNNGGGGGGGGGAVLVAAWKFAGTGVIQARGGNGGSVTVSTLGAGGGGGGGGGYVVVVSSSVVAGAVAGQTIDANGGAAGAGHGTTVTAASPGSAGLVVLVKSL